MRDGPSPGATIRLEIPSEFRWLDVLDAGLMALSEELGWDREFTNAVSISAIEAASNAVEHGNGMDPGKRVGLRIELTRGKLLLAVRDEGPGVDATILDRPAPGPGDLAVRGRGFSIMKALMDDLRFGRRGRGCFVLELEKALPEQDAPE